MNWHAINFDWNHLRAFLVTAEQGTLSAAAKALNSTQPTLSRQVYALENALNVSLFERVGQRLELTQSGVQLLTYARAMGSAANDFALSASGQAKQLEGLVTLSASELTATYQLPQLVAEFRELEPGIQIEIVVTNEVSDLKRREADIAIRSFRPSQSDLIAKKVGTEVIWLYGTVNYIATLPKINAYKALGDVQIIGFDSTHSVINRLNPEGWQLTKNNFSLVTASQHMQIALCKAHQGLIFFPEHLSCHEPTFQQAFAKLGPIFELPVWLVSHKELRTSLRVRRVFDFLAERLTF